MFTRTIPSPKLVEKWSAGDDLGAAEVNDSALPRLAVAAIYSRAVLVSLVFGQPCLRKGPTSELRVCVNRLVTRYEGPAEDH
jgi:hypothetical protein